jgi:hypothetical protein
MLPGPFAALVELGGYRAVPAALLYQDNVTVAPVVVIALAQLSALMRLGEWLPAQLVSHS